MIQRTVNLNGYAYLHVFYLQHLFALITVMSGSIIANKVLMILIL
jgi:hypothetical protein